MEAQDDFEAMLNDINRAVGDGDLELTEWEDDFLTSVSNRIDSGVELTQPQDDTLTALWKKATDH